MNASQMNDLFGDSSDDESASPSSTTMSKSVPGCFGPIYQATRVFVDQYSAAPASTEAEPDAIPQHLSNDLSEAVQLFLAHASGSGDATVALEQVGVLSSKCADTAWALLHEKKAWPHLCWRELFLVASLMNACALIADAQFLQALRATDRAFMLGAPKHITNLVFRLVDPLVVDTVSGAAVHGGSSCWPETVKRQ
jgi:hypothetical protein